MGEEGGAVTTVEGRGCSDQWRGGGCNDHREEGDAVTSGERRGCSDYWGEGRCSDQWGEGGE